MSTQLPPEDPVEDPPEAPDPPDPPEVPLEEPPEEPPDELPDALPEELPEDVPLEAGPWVKTSPPQAERKTKANAEAIRARATKKRIAPYSSRAVPSPLAEESRVGGWPECATPRGDGTSGSGPPALRSTPKTDRELARARAGHFRAILEGRASAHFVL